VRCSRAETARQRWGVIESPAVAIARAGCRVTTFAKTIAENIATMVATECESFNLFTS
jgi:hypothetical protein